MSIVTRTFLAEGMICQGCEETIYDAVFNLPGVKNVRADFKSGFVWVEFDNGQTTPQGIVEVIEAHGYPCSVKRGGDGTDAFRSLSLILLGFAGIGAILFIDVYFVDHLNLPSISQDMSYGLLFLVGVLTGFHCVGMCGGFIVGYTAREPAGGRQRFFPHIAYGFGKTISYTFFGAIFGLLGSVVAFTPDLRAGAAIIAGLFLILYGMKMVDLMPVFRHFGLRMPRVILSFRKNEARRYSHPFVIGLLNGLMIACGPLQAMYVLAAGSGSPVEGAKVLFLFGLGTLPVLFGFGFLTSVISAHATHRLLRVSGYIVILLGAIMLNRGLAMTGGGYDFHSAVTLLKNRLQAVGEKPVTLTTQDGYQVVYMVVKGDGYHPSDFHLARDVPVKWVIEGQELTGCNRGIIVPKLGLEFEVGEGVQLVEFTPREEGIISWSCWMGMMEGSFTVHGASEPAAGGRVISRHRPWNEPTVKNPAKTI
ncbi:MAG: sulfite exporter TauE/SafE family protein [Pseudomonadota bacterium]